MKNKLVTAILLGMVLAMSAPLTTVFAEPAAIAQQESASRSSIAEKAGKLLSAIQTEKQLFGDTGGKIRQSINDAVKSNKEIALPELFKKVMSDLKEDKAAADKFAGVYTYVVENDALDVVKEYLQSRLNDLPKSEKPVAEAEKALSAADDYQKISDAVKSVVGLEFSDAFESCKSFGTIQEQKEGSKGSTDETSMTLEEKKNQAKLQLDELASGIEFPELKIAVADIVDSAKKGFDSANSKSEVDSSLSAATSMIHQKKEEFKAQEAVAQKKKVSTDELDFFAQSISDAELKAKADEIAKRASAGIGSATTEAAVDEFASQAKAEIQTLLDQNEAQKKLVDEKAAIKAKLNELLTSEKYQLVAEMVNNIVPPTLAKVSEANDVASVDKLYDDTIKQLDAELLKAQKAMELAAAKSEYTQKVKALVEKKGISAELEETLQAVLKEIDAATSKEEVDKCYEKALHEYEKELLPDVREKYKEKLDELVGTFQENGSYEKIVETSDKAKENIDAAMSNETIKQIYDKAVDTISKLVEDSSNNLDKAKKEAIAELEKAADGKTSEAQKVVAIYTNRINSADTTSEVTEQVNEGLGILNKIGKVDLSNSGPGGKEVVSSSNGASDSSDGKAVSDATGKGDDTVKGKDVKTGDENAVPLVISVAGIIAGLGAIIVIFVKKFRKY